MKHRPTPDPRTRPSAAAHLQPSGRRRFLTLAGYTFASASLIALAACSDDGESGDTGAGGGGGDGSGANGGAGPGAGGSGGGVAGCSATTVSANHGHALEVPAADVSAGSEKTYSISGQSGHEHNVTLTAADFAKLQNNESVTVASTSGAGHTHDVTITCS